MIETIIMTSSTFNNNSHNIVPSSRKTIITPLPNDVLCGHDKKYLQHPGNELYKRQIIDYSVTYNSCGKDRLKKMKITKTVVDNMKLWYNSRFLKQTHLGEWEELTSKQARDRVSHAIRFYVKSNMNQSNGNNNNNFMLDDDNNDDEYNDCSASSDSSSDPKQPNGRSASDSNILPSNVRTIEVTNTTNNRAQSDGNILLGYERTMYNTNNSSRETSMSLLPTIPSTNNDNTTIEEGEENEEDLLFRRQQENLRRLMYSYEDRDNSMPI
jgi:hypothetical protein